MATGVRPLGGLVLLGLAVAAGRELPKPRWPWYTTVLACFVGSHLLADLISAWGAVAVVTAVATAAYASQALRRIHSS